MNCGMLMIAASTSTSARSCVLFMSLVMPFRQDEVAQDGLLQWARHTKLANMELERLLALMKASTAEKYPLVEHLAATSLLTQVLREHRRAEGDDPRRAQRRADLLRQGVPLACKKKQAMQAKNRGSACGMFWYVKSRMARGKRTKQQRNVERRRLSQHLLVLARRCSGSV